MRRIAKILSFICLGVVILSAIQLAGKLPADNGAYIEKKYSGWSGVLRGWVYSDWKCAGSFISWLNSCAAEFEKQHDGVYLEFETVNRQALDAPGLHPPDMLIFSEGAIDMEAAPIARGGYITVENPSASNTAVSPDHILPMIAMHAEEEIDVPDSGIDLGLPAISTMQGIEIREDAFQEFMNGGLGRTIIDQAQLSKLIALRESGRGPEWKCVAQGRYNWRDRRLMLGIKAVDDAQRQLCGEFLSLLLADDQQAALGMIGAFPVTEICAYDSFSPYHAMEQQMRLTKPLFQKPEHSASALEDLVRKARYGEITWGEAAEILAQTCS